MKKYMDFKIQVIAKLLLKCFNLKLLLNCVFVNFKHLLYFLVFNIYIVFRRNICLLCTLKRSTETVELYFFSVNSILIKMYYRPLFEVP